MEKQKIILDIDILGLNYWKWERKLIILDAFTLFLNWAQG